MYVIRCSSKTVAEFHILKLPKITRLPFATSKRENSASFDASASLSFAKVI